MVQRDGGGARGRPAAIFFILFNYEKFVSPGPQAVRAAWVNIWGVRRVCGAAIMFKVLFCFSCFCTIFRLARVCFRKRFHQLLFDLLVDVFALCIPFFRNCVLTVGCDV